MIHLKEELGKLPGGKVLDVATRYGEFAFKLKAGLPETTVIYAIDNSEKTIAKAKEKFHDSGIIFEVMDAQKLRYPDIFFDSVCVSNSLHHIENIDDVIKEMLRVLKTGGTLIINEMFCDNQDLAQQTHVALHHLESKIDRALGIYQVETSTNAELSAWFMGLCLDNTHIFEDHETDPELDKKLSIKAEQIVEKAQLLKERAQYDEILQEAKNVFSLYKKNGIRRCTQLVMMGEKKADL
ncbi:class I SAM-dependent methyltransferase [Petroclostridium sp. X23]|uniref:class I SAM-dependent methyltransferase n=1 Tax=Petroclostridium sp. X23 TaxID=3045146 RepID=UPI0024AD73DD|nr:class I SAM-dependent methyltransferase [Petroclostridium sp. X23]WHH61130.1 class I SAM-dependent methyltransferase [Petroclostridium sp. X23]